MDNVLINRANVPAAQTWNRLRANSLSVTVPNHADAGKVYLPLPRLFERIECGMGQEVTDYVESQAFKSDFYNVPARTKRDEPIVVAVSAAQNQCANTGIIVREGAEATVVIAAFAGDVDGDAPTGSDANDDALPTSAALTRIVVEAGAKLHLIEMLGVNEGQQHLESVGLEIHQDAAVDVKQYALGGSTIGLGLTANLVGAQARLDLNNRYHATHEETLDINHLVRMRGTSTRALLTESGVLNEAAKKTLRATIDLVRGAKDAQGNEIETVMILGDDVVNKTMPAILCDEDDVAGNHGATIGSVSPEQLDYLAARGLSHQAAEQMFIRALFEDAIINAPEEISHRVAVERCEAELGAEIAHDYDGSAASDDAAGNSLAASDGRNSDAEADSSKGGVA
ncbi:SufB/sufD domain protein [Atopobium sp. ICM42b]|uniref:SufB/SufD family protein n=1 Tax=unclassified Atopobium TaxID=2643817 RepID=UPI000448E28F|nr:MULTISPECIES: SufD family Fe-S cluster assembly protein [unclassified Atopobium]EWC93593.1 SufB/sufD domain protein [Atopobium sp. BS2]EWC94671.1 SufB/sufD domain protein [Atopobium sp. ICM42b]